MYVILVEEISFSSTKYVVWHINSIESETENIMPIGILIIVMWRN